MTQQPLYILSASAISPQQTFDAEAFLNPVLESDNNRLHVVDPDYSKFINPVAIRRMSRIIKMGISAGMRSLQKANIEQPNAIIVGTGKGSVTDTERFLNDMIAFKEEALNPTYFIQSTYNSINGWLAMQTKCTGYNQTYVHRGFSFELCLLDAQLMLADTEEKMNVLLGCFDEMSPDYYTVKEKVDYWKKEKINSKKLLEHNDTEGTIGGEGASFFTVSNKSEGAICSIEYMNMLQQPDMDNIQDAIEDALSQANIQQQDIDVLLCGKSGDSRYEWIYEIVASTLGDHTTIAAYKHITGDYDTTSGFATWLATYLFEKQEVPAELIQHKGNSNSIKHILLVNHHILGTASVLLLKLQA
jgi:3-oxoacyl-[acyl-carrier-protein] synthase II